MVFGLQGFKLTSQQHKEVLLRKLICI